MELAPSQIAALDRLLIRETLEAYLGALDDRDWAGIAACFTDDAVSHYNDQPEDILGGQGVADWLHRMVAYNGTNHTLGNARITVDGDKALARTMVIATLHEGEPGVGRVQVRGIDYEDKLVRLGPAWKIRERLHRPVFQYDALSQRKILYAGQATLG